MRRSFVWGVALVTSIGCYKSHTIDDEADGRPDASRDTAVDALVDAPADTSVDVAFDSDLCFRDPEACEVVARLDGLRWELPCDEVLSDAVCATVEATRDRTMFAPELRGRSFAVTLRFRGVIETKEYRGGEGEGYFSRGGTPDGTNWNIYALVTSSPNETYYLNNGGREPFFCEAIDYSEEIVIDAGSRVELIGEVLDARQILNIDQDGVPIVIDGVAPAPEPFNGQFIQMDVVAIREL